MFWIAVAVLLLRWGWALVRPVGPPVVALVWGRSHTFTSLVDRNGRWLPWVRAPDEVGGPGPLVFSAADGTVYLGGEGGIFRWRAGEWRPVLNWFPMSSATVSSFAVSRRGSVVYSLRPYLGVDGIQWFLWHSGESVPRKALPFGAETEFDAWLPDGERLIGRQRGEWAVFTVSADGTVTARPVARPKDARGPVHLAADDLLLARDTPEGSVLQRWPLAGPSAPLTLAERPAARIFVGPVSPDGRLVACVVAPPLVDEGGFLPVPGPGPYYLEVIDVVTGQSFVRHRVEGEIERVVWPTDGELYFESFERLSKAEAKMRWGPPKDIVRLTLEPPRAKVIARTELYLIGAHGLPRTPLAVDTEGAVSGVGGT